MKSPVIVGGTMTMPGLTSGKRADPVNVVVSELPSATIIWSVSSPPVSPDSAVMSAALKSPPSDRQVLSCPGPVSPNVTAAPLESR